MENDEDWKLPESADEEEDDLGADIEGDWVDIKDDEDINISGAEDEDNGELPKEKNGIKKKYLKYMQKSKKKRQAQEDDDSDLELSDDESGPSKKKKKIASEKEKEAAENEKAIQETLSSVLTPADFAKLKELNQKAGIEKIMGVNTKHEDEVDSTSLVGKFRYKQNKEERLEHVKEGREDRGEFGSRKGKREQARSTTNREKQRKKNFIMTIHKRSVQGKQKMSLRDRQKVLRAHVERQKMKK
ncbi:unnamed protein product [Ambrosiozyma monospora]|uniref:Unnamed protein product n=1 Tax=Ambrosiozyma monospora TaxID=43982 RepID=A0ACB5T2H1_AMBMO|nr:unnamed protein product [Ambrosiozyma monospora]